MKAKPPLEVKSKEELLSLLNSLDLPSLLHQKPPILVLEIAYQLVKLCKVYNVPIPPYLTWPLKDLKAAYKLYEETYHDAMGLAVQGG